MSTRTVTRNVTRPVTRSATNAIAAGFLDPSLTLHYDFAKSKSLSPQNNLGPVLGITRATTASYFDGAGTMQTAASGEARFDHNPSTNASLGLLVEEARTNLCLSSELFTDADWTETNTDQPSTNNLAPDGALTADEIAATSTADQAFAIYQAFTGRTAAEVTTVSCFLKAGTNATFAQLAYDDGGAGDDGFFCNFRLDDGTKGTVTAFAAGTATSSSIEDIGSGWYKCSIVGSIAVGTTARLTLSITDIITAAGFEAANLTDNDSIIAWGCQLEVGAFPTSYTPTTTVAVVRDVDSITTTDVGWSNGIEGSFYSKASILSTARTAAGRVLQVSDAGGVDHVTLYIESSEVPTFTSANSGGTNGLITTPAIAANTMTEFAGAYANDDMVFYDDGTAGTPDTSAAFPLNDTFTTFIVGGRVGSARPLNGHIAVIKYFNKRHDNATLEGLSNGIFP